jgi:hypothetical protein
MRSGCCLIFAIKVLNSVPELKRNNLSKISQTVTRRQLGGFLYSLSMRETRQLFNGGNIWYTVNLRLRV